MLRRDGSGLRESKERFEQDQAKLRKGLITLLVQTVPAPRTKLSDETWPEVPPVRALLKEADRAMADSMKHLSSGGVKRCPTKARPSRH